MTALQSNEMRLAAWYGILVGLSMFAQWGLFLATGQVPEVKTEPIRLAFHLAAEWSTALALIAGGIGLLGRLPWGAAVYLVGAGMLFYSVIVSPGYFAQQGQWIFVLMSGLLLVLALASVRAVTRTRED